MEGSGIIQVVMATHSPMLMANPGARRLRFSSGGLDPVTVGQTDHFRLMQRFCCDPHRFLKRVLDDR